MFIKLHEKQYSISKKRKKLIEHRNNYEQRFLTGMWPWVRREENNNLLSAVNVSCMSINPWKAGLSAAPKRAQQKADRGKKQRPPDRNVLLTLKDMKSFTVNPPPLFRLCLWSGVMRAVPWLQQGNAAAAFLTQDTATTQQHGARRKDGGVEVDEVRALKLLVIEIFLFPNVIWLRTKEHCDVLHKDNVQKV